MISKEEILRIASDYQKTALERIDQLLKEDANSYTNLGTDSTKTEKEEVKRNSRAIYRAIKDLDEPTGKLLLQDQDGY
jgi:DNA-directed RNA polymerase specialized sigma subunit